MFLLKTSHYFVLCSLLRFRIVVGAGWRDQEALGFDQLGDEEAGGAAPLLRHLRRVGSARHRGLSAAVVASRRAAARALSALGHHEPGGRRRLALVQADESRLLRPLRGVRPRGGRVSAKEPHKQHE